MIYGLDFDGTLVESFDGTEPLRGVRAQLARHAAAGDRLFIATNQAGPTFRAMLGSEKYPTPEAVVARLASALVKLGLASTSTPVLVSLGVEQERAAEWHAAAYRVMSAIPAAVPDLWFPDANGPALITSADPRWRKPLPGMLHTAAALFGVELAEVCYIGDRPEDRAAALAAGAYFLDAQRWRRGERDPSAGPGDGPPER